MLNCVCLDMDFDFGTEEICENIHNTLIIETKIKLNDRAHVSITREGKRLLIKLNATDTVSARAAANSYLKWLKLSLELIENIQ